MKLTITIQDLNHQYRTGNHEYLCFMISKQIFGDADQSRKAELDKISVNVFDFFSSYFKLVHNHADYQTVPMWFINWCDGGGVSGYVYPKNEEHEKIPHNRGGSPCEIRMKMMDYIEKNYPEAILNIEI